MSELTTDQFFDEWMKDERMPGDGQYKSPRLAAVDEPDESLDFVSVKVGEWV